MKDASKVKPKSRSPMAWLCLTFIAAAVIATITLGVYWCRVQMAERAERAVIATTQPFLQLLMFSAQVSLAGVERVLLHGTEEERLQVFQQLAELNPADIEEFPMSIYNAIESNLDHESLRVRDQARSTLGLIQTSPWFESVK